VASKPSPMGLRQACGIGRSRARRRTTWRQPSIAWDPWRRENQHPLIRGPEKLDIQTTLLVSRFDTHAMSIDAPLIYEASIKQTPEL